MEPIKLEIISPPITLKGVEAAIETLTELDALIERIAARKQVVVDFTARGVAEAGAEIRKASGALGALVENLEAMGRGDLAAKMKAGFASGTEELKATDRLIKEIIKDQEKLSAQSEKAWSAGKPDPKLNQRIGAANDAETFANLHRGDVKDAIDTGAWTAAVQAEQAVTGAAKEADAALGAQKATATSKAKEMAALAEQTKKVAAADRDSAAAAGEAAQAQQGGLISTKVMRDAEGAVINTQKTIRTAIGQTVVDLQDATITTTSELEKFRNAFRKVDADFAARKGGTLPGSREEIALLQQEAEANRAVVEQMRQRGLIEESLAQQRGIKANNLESRATRGGAVADIQAAAEAEKQAALAKKQADADAAASYAQRAELERQLITQMRLEALAVDNVTARNKAAAQTEGENAAAVRQAAEAYAQLNAQMQRLGAGESNFGQTIQRQANRLEAEATRLERVIAQSQSRADMNAGAAHSAAKGFDDPVVQRTASGSGGSRQQTTWQRDNDGLRETIRLTEEYDVLGNRLSATMAKTNKPIEEARTGIAGLASTMVSNVGSIALWSAGVGVLYGALGMLKNGVASMIDIERQTAGLQAVFRGSAEGAIQLRDDILQLAIANGRAADEALEAGVSWARFGLDVHDTAAAVQASMVLANVGEMTVAESAKSLSSIYAQYNLQASDLRNVVGELNAISNTYNVTNKDMIGGIQRVGAFAAAAKIPLADLMGLIGSAVGRTGRSGAEIGNALKTVLSNVTKPRTQEVLHDQFKVDVKDTGGDLKPGMQIIEEMALKYQELSSAEKQELVVRVAGTQQASRLTAILNGYVQGQVLAITAQQNLNSAERETAIRLAVTDAQLERLKTSWSALFTEIGKAGGNSGLQNILVTLEGIVVAAEKSAEAVNAVKNLSNESKIGRFGNETMEGMTKAMVPGLELLSLFNQIGASANQTGDKIESYQQKLSDAKNEASAAKSSEDLAGHLKKSLPHGNKAEQEDQIKAYSEVVSGSDPEKAARREEMLDLVRKGDLQRLNLKLDQDAALFRERGKAQYHDVNELIQKAIDEEKAHLAVIQQRIDRGEDTDGKLKGERTGSETKIQRYKTDLTQNANDLSNAVSEEGGGGESYYDKETRAVMTLKAELEGIDRLTSGMPLAADTETEKLNQQLAVLQQKADFLRQAKEMADQNDTALRQSIQSQQDDLAIQREKLNILREYAQQQDAVAAGVRSANNQSSAFRVGDNETEKSINEAANITGTAIPGAEKPTANLLGSAQQAASTSTGNDKLREEATALQLMNRLSQIQLELESKRYSVQAEIVNKRREEAEAASKSVQTASRPDQVKAALTAKYVQQNGGKGFSNEQFQFLDQSTREGIEKYNPTALPPAFRQDQAREQKLIEGSRDPLNKAVQSATNSVNRTDTRASGYDRPAPQSPPVHVNMQFDSQFAALTGGIQKTVLGVLNAQIGKMNARMDNFMNGLKASSAQRAGTSVS